MPCSAVSECIRFRIRFAFRRPKESSGVHPRSTSCFVRAAHPSKLVQPAGGAAKGSMRNAPEMRSDVAMKELHVSLAAIKLHVSKSMRQFFRGSRCLTAHLVLVFVRAYLFVYACALQAELELRLFLRPGVCQLTVWASFGRSSGVLRSSPDVKSLSLIGSEHAWLDPP